MTATTPFDDVRKSAFSKVWIGCADEIKLSKSSPTLVEMFKEVWWELRCSCAWKSCKAGQSVVEDKRSRKGCCGRLKQAEKAEKAEKEDEDRMGGEGVDADECKALSHGFSINRAQLRKAAGVFDDGYRRLVASAETVAAEYIELTSEISPILSDTSWLPCISHKVLYEFDVRWDNDSWA